MNKVKLLQVEVCRLTAFPPDSLVTAQAQDVVLVASATES